ncbi:TIGR04283 family arsenosugar biosynthesis glycosyltransferase [Thermodesulfobacteriota bacterium]
MRLSIIIPVLNEAKILVHTLPPLSRGDYEIIVVDGGSHDETPLIAGKYTPHVIESKRGRGKQQHEGALRAGGDGLLFVHADTFLPKDFNRIIGKTLSDPTIVLGAFYLKIHPPSKALNIVAFGANLRAFVFRLPYGDQALFMRRSDYYRVGGFKDIPVMEDVDLVRRLNRIGRLKLIKQSVSTSSRRWDKEGALYATLRNWSLVIRYLLGVSPHRLHRFYSDSR